MGGLFLGTIHIPLIEGQSCLRNAGALADWVVSLHYFLRQVLERGATVKKRI